MKSMTDNVKLNAKENLSSIYLLHTELTCRLGNKATNICILPLTIMLTAGFTLRFLFLCNSCDNIFPLLSS